MAKGAGRPRTVIPDGDKIIELRLKKGIETQLDFHERSTVSLHKISDIENSKPTSLAILNKVAEFLDLEDGTTLIKHDCPSSCPFNCRMLGDITILKHVDRSIIEAAFAAALQAVVRECLDSVYKGSIRLQFTLDEELLLEMVRGFFERRLQLLGVYEISFNVQRDLSEEMASYLSSQELLAGNVTPDSLIERFRVAERRASSTRAWNQEVSFMLDVTRFYYAYEWRITSTLSDYDITCADTVMEAFRTMHGRRSDAHADFRALLEAARWFSRRSP